MATLGQKPATTHVSFQKQTITGNGGASYTLQQSVGSELDIAVFINNTRQEPTTAYTASGTSLVMTGTVNSSDNFYVIFLAKAINTTGLPVSAVNTSSINASAVTTDKIADTAVTNAKIANSTIDLTSKVTGVLPTANGGTGFSSRPAFLAKKLGGSNVTSGNRVDFETIVINVGSGYTITGGDAYKFICPAAGLYQLQTQCLSTNNSSANDIDMYINSSLHQRVRQDVSANAHNTLNISTIANLSLNDAVYIYVSGGDGISAAGSHYTSFSGFLIE